MILRIVIIASIFSANILLARDASTVSLKDSQGRELICTIISKSESSVKVINLNGREFEIPVTKLDDYSRSIVYDWIDPSLELFNLLNSEYIEIHQGVDSGDKDWLNMIKLYLDLSKQYGEYIEFGTMGVPMCRLSFASLIFALSDFKYDKLIGRLIHRHYTSSTITTRLTGSAWTTGNFTYATVINNAAKNWPKNLPNYTFKDLRNLQREMLELSQSIAKRNPDSRRLDSKYYVSQDVKKYSKLILNIIKPHKDKLVESR